MIRLLIIPVGALLLGPLAAASQPTSVANLPPAVTPVSSGALIPCATPGVVGSTMGCTPVQITLSGLLASSQVTLNNAGVANPLPAPTGNAEALTILGNGLAGQARVNVVSYGSPGAYNGYRMDGPPTAATAVQAGEGLVAIGGAGYDGSALSGAAALIQLQTFNSWTTSDHSSQLVFITTPSGSTIREPVLLLAQDGSTDPAADNTFNLGTTLLRWANLNAVNVSASTVTASGLMKAASPPASDNSNSLAPTSWIDTYFAPLLNPAFLGSGSIAGTWSAYILKETGGGIYADGAAGTNRALNFTTSSVIRWKIYSDYTAETGSNAGSNFYIQGFSDSGALLDTAMFVNRATGAMTFDSVGAGATFGGAVSGKAATFTSYTAGSTAGVTCSGVPTSSFAVTNGIVTHC